MLTVVRLDLLRICIFDVSDRAFRILHIVGDTLVAFGPNSRRPFDEVLAPTFDFQSALTLER